MASRTAWTCPCSRENVTCNASSGATSISRFNTRRKTRACSTDESDGFVRVCTDLAFFAPVLAQHNGGLAGAVGNDVDGHAQR